MIRALLIAIVIVTGTPALAYQNNVIGGCLSTRALSTQRDEPPTPEISESIYIILSVFVPFIAVGIMTDWQGTDWLTCLALTLISFNIFGIVYALHHMNKYFAPYR
jgi:uncharacterized membrane protein YqaE (UPF0057 family)